MLEDILTHLWQYLMLLAVKKPTIELHITNIYKREDFRHKSLISKSADGIICGLGVDGYIMALDGIKEYS